MMTSSPPSTGRNSVSNLWAFAGVILMGLSLFLWVCLLGVPFLPLSVAARWTVATALIVIAEVAFWLGAVMAGPATLRRMRSWWHRPRALLHESELARTDPGPQLLHRPMRYDIGRPSPVI